jgi:hypothetical protein
MGLYTYYFRKNFNRNWHFPLCSVSYCWGQTSCNKWWRMIRHERRMIGEEIVWWGHLSELPNYLLCTKPGSIVTCFTSLAVVRARRLGHVLWVLPEEHVTTHCMSYTISRNISLPRRSLRRMLRLKMFFWVVACSPLNPMECIPHWTFSKSLSSSCLERRGNSDFWLIDRPTVYNKQKTNKLRGLSPQANYIDRGTAARLRS